ncbi:MAG TPA: 2-C-methyl-D-erythritol 4-phosphate cytidylyltransferase [Pyrinomonadaceae bacterium]|nr:2-C-methyl-D-erythritol 4-phosphate cytidylyltransferase [Pyrinomonadaceae bacterium]
MNTAIIAAAGKGNRMATDRPKQFLEVLGIPIIFHTLKRFEQCDSIDELVVVLPAEESAGFLSLAGKYGLRKLARVVPGGNTRTESVKRGFMSIRPATAHIVAVHDAVRPLVTVEEIEKTIAAADLIGAAILTNRVTDTIKRVAGNSVVETIDRDTLRRAVTPQCFRYGLLRRAFDEADATDVALTDESSLVERLGHPVSFVEGSPLNIKITTPHDLLVAEAYLAAEEGL